MNHNNNALLKSGAKILLNYADKSDDPNEYVKVELANLYISNVITKEFEHHGTCYPSLIRSAAGSLSATIDENDKKQKEETSQEQCFN